MGVPRDPGEGARFVPDDQLIELNDRAAAKFLTIPGVTAVGLGGLERGGRPTGEVVLKVFVERKRSATELTPGELLPAQFEGVGVDVVELPEPTLATGAIDLEAVAAPPQPGSRGTSATDLDERSTGPSKAGPTYRSRSMAPGWARSAAS
jgi:hypothetical protein